MNIKPILFNTEMVKAILEGRKTQTRRILKTRHGGELEIHDDPGGVSRLCEKCGTTCHGLVPPCEPGDVLWVRETFDDIAVGHPWYYKADGDLRPECWKGEQWRPSIHMPKEAARIFLKVKDVRVERLQDIGNADAIAEGFDGTPCNHENANPALGCTDCYNTGWLEPPYAEFAQLWDTTIKPADLEIYGWEANPFVWVVEFYRCEKPEGWCE